MADCFCLSLRSVSMVEQLLAEHRCHVRTAPHDGNDVYNVEQLAEELELLGDDLARSVLSESFFARYDRLHDAAHNLGRTPSAATSINSTAARSGPTVIFLHKNDGSPLVLGKGHILRIDPSSIRPKAFDGFASGNEMDEVLDRVTQKMKLQSYARRLFRPDGECIDTPSTHPSHHLCVCARVRVCLLACLPACLSACLPACLPVCLSACQPACLLMRS